MKPAIKALLGTALVILSSSNLLQAQIPGSQGVNTILVKLFGKHNNFSVVADMRMSDSKGTESRLTFDMAVLNGDLRFDIDAANAQGTLMDPAQIAQAKAMGMNRATTIVRPDKNEFLLIYPLLKSYLDINLPKNAAQSFKADVKIEKTAVSKETIDGHPCVKTKVVMTDPKGQKQESYTWDATDLKDFPIQVQMVENGNTILMHYRQIKLAKPDAKQFDAPVGFTKYDDMESMVTKLMMGSAKTAQPKR